MDAEALARATAAGMGRDVETATRDLLSGAETRAFGLTEAMAIGSLIVSAGQLAVTNCGSIIMPTETKKIAANISRMGLTKRSTR